MEFDDGVADALLAAIDEAEIELARYGRVRFESVEHALVDFVGPHADQLVANADREAEERLRLLGRLGDLAEDVRAAKERARREVERAAAYAAWEQRDLERRMDPTGGSAFGSAFTDPMPDDRPGGAPVVSIALEAIPRVHDDAVTAGSRKVSADPSRLRDFVGRCAPCRAQVERSFAELASAWVRFRSECRWVVCESSGLPGVFAEISAANTDEERWVTRVAEAFEEAGGGALLAAFLMLYAAASNQSADAQELTRKLRDMTDEERIEYLGSDGCRTWAAAHPAGAKTAMDAAANDGLIPTKSEVYATFLSDYWNNRAMARAGIDSAAWDPELGTTQNWDTIQAVYEYYGRLYLEDPKLQWAGMANLVGPSFAGAFQDLAYLREVAQIPGRVPPGRVSLPQLPLLKAIGGVSAEEFKFYETSMLKMQKEIFLDLARQHEAYRVGGIEEVERLNASGAIEADVALAWNQIDSNEPAQVSDGNERLLSREQNEIIKNDYDRMRNRFPTGPAVTTVITMIGQPSIPGAKSYTEVFPQRVPLLVPGLRKIPFTDLDNPAQFTAKVPTGLPEGNISVDKDRWALIERDTLPAYRRLITRDPDGAERLIGADLGKRIENARSLRNLDDIAVRFAGGLAGVEIEQ